MARLGALDLAPGVETALYIPPGATRATVKVLAANRTAGPILVRIVRRVGVGPTAAPDYLTFDEPIPANESRHSEYVDMVTGEELLAQANVAGLTVQADGIERTA